MPTDFGVPPIADENRTLVEQRIQDVHAGEAVPETLRVEFRNRPIHVEVIDMPVDRLYYNPATHRVSAQRAYDPVREEALTKDHWSDAGQSYLHYLLTAMPSDPHQRDPDFDKLKESLREHRQNEPGLISREGVLVNGNTRRAALKELGVQSIRVGVLPASCSWDDIRSVELSLQLRPDRRREYSYVNKLMAIEEQMSQGLPLAAIAKLFQTSTPALERDTWVLGQLRDLVKRSGNGQIRLRLMDFEDAKESFAELYRAYVKEKARNKEAADTLLEYRLAAIVLDFAKTDIRNIRTDFRERYLERHLPEGTQAAAPEPPKAVSIPGLNRSVPAPSSGTSGARALTDVLLRAKPHRSPRRQPPPRNSPRPTRPYLRCGTPSRNRFRLLPKRTATGRSGSQPPTASPRQSESCSSASPTWRWHGVTTAWTRARLMTLFSYSGKHWRSCQPKRQRVSSSPGRACHGCVMRWQASDDALGCSVTLDRLRHHKDAGSAPCPSRP
ncbi:transcriptional regulator [Streptomyces sp. NPDC090057]|uniref:transcriptional regulator n=1 Tax=Streptomyces sp. NPDC090057 TaxID=3365935 RepID=UPI00381B92D5